MKKQPKSMFLEPETFDVHVFDQGHGYLGAHVQVRNWTYPAGQPNTILISRDALTEEEFDLHVDELIELLNELRDVGKEKIRTMKNAA